jgi:hypothetical protein
MGEGRRRWEDEQCVLDRGRGLDMGHECGASR